MKSRYCLVVLFIVFFTFPHGKASSQDVSMLLGKDHDLHASFLDFAYSRIQVLNRNFVNSADKILIESRDDLCVARYQQIDPSTVNIEVKKVSSNLTPFIGVLIYTESIFENNGSCQASLADGPFMPVRHRKVTEIFRYVQSRWQ